MVEARLGKKKGPGYLNQYVRGGKRGVSVPAPGKKGKKGKGKKGMSEEEAEA